MSGRHALIVGAGVAGLAAALTLHRAGWRVTVSEAVSDLRPLGLGINLLPHGAAVLEGLGLTRALRENAMMPAAFEFRTRFGHVLQRDPRGIEAGFAAPQYSIHRGTLQAILREAVETRIPGALRLGHRFVGAGQDGRVAGRFRRPDGSEVEIAADVLIGADGFRSAVRRMLHPGEGPPNYEGITMWRGALWRAPFGDGRTAVIAGNHDVKVVFYPIARRGGEHLVNWVAEVRQSPRRPLDEADWTQPGDRAFMEAFRDFRMHDIDVIDLMARTEAILEYPMIDRDPLPWWTRGRITLAGDAAHPMYPVGANGASQAILDAAALERHLAQGEPAAGLAAYEAERLPQTSAVVLSNRASGPEEVLDIADARLTGPDDPVEQLIRPDESEAVAARYRRVAGFRKAGET